MDDSFELKTISTESLPRAVENAEHYRLLNDPEQAESICLDVLAVDPANQDALRVLVLALTDQFAQGRASGARTARESIAKLADAYERAYYEGIVCERQARAFLGRSGAASIAYEPFREAMRWYERAERIRPPGNDDAMLRWNSCLRTLRRERLEPPVDSGELPLE